MRTSYTAVVERNVMATGEFASEPYECGWASEAIIFVRTLEGSLSGVEAAIQLSPDGMNWCNEGGTFPMPEEGELTCVRVSHFGNWLRFKADMGSDQAKILVTIHLKE